MILCIPFSMISAICSVMFVMKRESNPLTLSRGQSLSGIKKGAFSRDIKISDLKKTARHHGSSFNDFMMAIISMSLHEYFTRKSTVQVEHVTLSLPASFKKNAKTADKLNLTNKVSPLFFRLSLGGTLEETLERV